MKPSARRIKSLNGERLIVLVDESGMPLFYPALYVTVHLRGRSLALNTIQNALDAGVRGIGCCFYPERIA
ncbi:hypothetical protein [Pseudomonas orientalis]|uniref:hypothetical protein n=1 Tax=Pseudomonas orientalis TaxID=76758 RepID=UPI001F5CBF9B|nr:hypothetical protein [Pseudomonas orientalis]